MTTDVPPAERSSSTASSHPPADPQTEPRGEHLRRHGRRTGLHLRVVLVVVLVAVLIALVAANTRSTRLDWVVGSGSTSLVWIIFVSAVLGWLIGLASSALFRRRTRRRKV